MVIALAATTGGFVLTSASAGPPPPAFNGVQPQVYDPSDTDSAQAMWVNGMGCMNATATHNTNNSNGSFTDPACATGFDASDEENAGLLLSKQGPTSTLSEGAATLGGIVKGQQLGELGYDIRTVNYPNSVSSHCGAGAPRFNVTTTAGRYFVGCRSPLATSSSSDNGQTDNGGWTRLRWGNGAAGSVMGFQGNNLVPITGTVQSISIAFDEGTDTGPDFFGAAVIDNIDFNKTLVGRG